MADSSASSFRDKGRLGQQLQRGGSARSLLDRGAALTQPSTSGLMYQIHILGEVSNPGTYRIMASERLSEVLQRSGGVADQGSNRKIEIRRNGKVQKRIDLLKFQLEGKLDHNPYLLDNDVVFVPLKDKTVQVVGAVKRPNIYELANEKKLSQVIKLAGGFSGGMAKGDPIRVIRFVNGKKEVIKIKQSDARFSNFAINNGDVIYISNVVTAGHEFDYDIAKLPGDNIFYPSYEDRVFVLGGVNTPGAYPFSPYYSIHQYISLAGGFTKMSTGKMHVLTSDGKKIKIKKNRKTIVNPGDTILVGHRRIPPEGWVSLGMSLASFGLSTTSTVLYLTDKR